MILLKKLNTYLIILNFNVEIKLIDQYIDENRTFQEFLMSF